MACLLARKVSHSQHLVSNFKTIKFCSEKRNKQTKVASLSVSNLTLQITFVKSIIVRNKSLQFSLNFYSWIHGNPADFQKDFQKFFVDRTNQSSNLFMKLLLKKIKMRRHLQIGNLIEMVVSDQYHYHIRYWK